MNSIGNAVVTSTGNVINNIFLFIPNFFAGLIILVIGWAVATALKTIVQRVITTIDPEPWLNKAGFDQSHSLRRWPNIVANVVYWFVFLAFLIPAFNAWQLPMVTAILATFLAYIPNVLAAVIIGFIGMIFANLAFNVVKNAASEMGSNASGMLANLAKYSLIVITVLMALNQLGVGANLIQVLLAGFVAMIAVAGGLAFGLGGQDTAREMLNQLTSNRPKMKTRAGRGVAYMSEVRKKEKNQ